jgi:hypothetical protein
MLQLYSLLNVINVMSTLERRLALRESHSKSLLRLDAGFRPVIPHEPAASAFNAAVSRSREVVEDWTVLSSMCLLAQVSRRIPTVSSPVALRGRSARGRLWGIDAYPASRMPLRLPYRLLEALLTLRVSSLSKVTVWHLRGPVVERALPQWPPRSPRARPLLPLWLYDCQEDFWGCSLGS